MNLNLIAPLNSLGYGVAGLNVSLALTSEGVNVSLFPIGPVEVDDSKRQGVEEMKTNAGHYDPLAPCLRIWHQHSMGEFVGKGLRCGFPFFELNRFNSRERHHLALLDKVCVASDWAKEVVQNQVGGDVFVAPLGVDREIFHENIETDKFEADHTIFFNAGKWEHRKGHDFLLAAFNKAFRPTDKVLLLMLCYNPFLGPRNDLWAKEYKGSAMGGKIKLIPRLTSQRLVARFLASGDCGVFPSRAEGWNLELLEAMSVGKHVICTHNTAHAMFANDRNARLITCDELEPAEDGVWFHGQGEWSKLGESQEEQLIAHLREIHFLKQTGRLTRNEPGIETAQSFSWQHTAGAILKGLQ